MGEEGNLIGVFEEEGQIITEDAIEPGGPENLVLDFPATEPENLLGFPPGEVFQAGSVEVGPEVGDAIAIDRVVAFGVEAAEGVAYAEEGDRAISCV